MFSEKKELLLRAFKKNGLPGILNILGRALDSRNRRPKSRFVPFSAQIEPTTKCNLRCEMCEHTHWTQKAEDLSFADFKKIVDNNPFLLTLNLTGIGESLLNNDFFRMVQYAKSNGIFTWFSDNMTLMNEENARKAIESGVDAIAVSLDGATRQTFESIRRGAKFEDVLRNTKRLIELKKELNSKKPALSITFVVMPRNFREMPAITRLAHGLGIKTVVFVGALEFEANKSLGFKKISGKEFEKAASEALKLGRELGIDLRLPAFREKPLAYSRCTLPWESAYISHKGEVLPCCFATQRNNPLLYKESVLGNAIKEPFAKIWNNSKYTALRQALLQNKPAPICQGCEKIKSY